MNKIKNEKKITVFYTPSQVAHCLANQPKNFRTAASSRESEGPGLSANPVTLKALWSWATQSF